MIDLPPFGPFIREADRDTRHPWLLPDRRLLDYLLVVVERGQCRFVVEDRVYLLGPYQVALIQPGDRATLQGLTETVTPYVHCDIFPQEGRAERFPTGAGFLDIAPYRHIMQPRLNDLLSVAMSPLVDVPDPAAFLDRLITCIGLWQSGTLLNRMEAHALLGCLLTDILRACLADKPSAPCIPATLQRLDGFLRRHLHEAVTVQAMADHVGVSCPHLTRLCRLYWRQAPHQRLLHLRIEHALRLLRNPDLSTAQIAHYCGFADAKHFGHVFQARLGCSPTQARRIGVEPEVPHLTVRPWARPVEGAGDRRAVI